jgi:hypothetical protein
MNSLESLLALFGGWLRHRRHFPYGLSQVLLGVRIYQSCSQNVIVGLMAPSGVLLLELALEFSIFLCQHIVVIKQMIPSLLAGLVRRCIIKLDMIMGKCSGVIYMFPS